MKEIKYICFFGAGYAGGPTMTVNASQRFEIKNYGPKVSRAQMLSDMNYLSTLIREENELYLTVVNDPYETADQAHAIAALTEPNEFKVYDFVRIFDQILKPAFIFDGRRLLDKTALKQKGFKFYTIGEW